MKTPLFILLLSTSPALAISPTRDFVIDGPRESQWSIPAPAANTASHEGRPVGSIEDRGRGIISFYIHAAAGRAQAAVYDLFDTHASLGHFTITIDGEKRSYRASEAAPNGARRNFILRVSDKATGWFRVVMQREGDFGPGRQDGFSVCKG